MGAALPCSAAGARTLCCLQLVALALLAASGCARIPEPESAAGRLYAQRCTAGCHRAYLPQTMKFEMWKIVVDRMQQEMARRGMEPLTGEEMKTLLAYLRRYSG